MNNTAKSKENEKKRLPYRRIYTAFYGSDWPWQQQLLVVKAYSGNNRNSMPPHVMLSAGHDDDVIESFGKLIGVFRDRDKTAQDITLEAYKTMTTQDMLSCRRIGKGYPLILLHGVMVSGVMFSLKSVAEKAMIHDFIISLPEGYEAQVGEAAGKLSGGEKQRISIARMILKDAPIIILDEMTSAIDLINERKIQRAMNNLVRGKTTLVIADHLYTIRHANQIIVMDEGKILEQEKHAELLALDGIYRRLWEAQIQAKEWKVVG